MCITMTVRISERTGLAYARVPGNAMWELVEYLAMNRTQVYYGYSKGGFTVTFLLLEQEAAQELLDRWADSWMMEPANEEARVEGRRELFSLAG